MRKFIYRLLGWECCGEWTQWEDRTANFERLTNLELDGPTALRQDTVVYTVRWQERRCTLCGKMQQRKLKQ